MEVDAQKCGTFNEMKTNGAALKDLLLLSFCKSKPLTVTDWGPITDGLAVRANANNVQESMRGMNTVKAKLEN